MPNFVGEAEDKHCKIAYYLFRLRECPPKLLFAKSQNAFLFRKMQELFFTFTEFMSANFQSYCFPPIFFISAIQNLPKPTMKTSEVA